MIRINLLRNDLAQKEETPSFAKDALAEPIATAPKNKRNLLHYILYTKSALLFFGLAVFTNSLPIKSGTNEPNSKKPELFLKANEKNENLGYLKTKLEFLKEFYTTKVDTTNYIKINETWLQRLDSFALQNDFKASHALSYIEKSQDRLYLYYNYIEGNRGKNLRYKSPLGSKQEVFEVLLSSLVAEYFYGIDAELGIAISMSETQCKFIKSFNGTGYFQLTMNSSLSDLNGFVDDKYYNNMILNLVNEHSKNKILVPRSRRCAFKYGFDNCMAAYETLLLKATLFKMDSDLPMIFPDGQITADHILQSRRNRLGVLLNYNGHGNHKENYSKRTNQVYENFVFLRTKLGYAKAPGVGLISLSTHY